jgi:hypothetical protein
MTFGHQPPRSHVPLEAVAEAHAGVIADSINRGWIVRGIKLGIGFWLAGLIIFAVSALFWTLVISGAITRFLMSAPGVNSEGAQARGGLASVIVYEPTMENDELGVIVLNSGSSDIRSLTVNCTIIDYSWNPTLVRSVTGSLDAGARVRVKLLPNLDPRNGTAGPCTVQ